MNKKELVEHVSNVKGIAYCDAESYVDLIFDTITKKIVDNEKVLISGFGTFYLHSRKGRFGSSPLNGEKIYIKPNLNMNFRQGSRVRSFLESKLNKYHRD